MDLSQQALTQWLEKRAAYWRHLDRELDRQRDSRHEDPTAVLDLVEGVRGLSRDLSLARQIQPGGRIARYLEALLVRGHDVLYRPPRNLVQELLIVYRDEIPALTERMRGTLLATVCLFLLCMLAGWLLVHHNPELAALFASQKMIDTVQGGKLWTDGLLNIFPSALLAFSIIANNITVTLFAFVLGAFYGIGTLYIIALNGFMLGGIFAFTGHYQLDGLLFEFVIAHGVVELSIICLAGAAGIYLGEALIRPGPRTRLAAFQDAVAQAGKLLLVGVPFLAGAGVIEGFVSPDPRFSLPVRVTLGLSYGALLWLVLSGRLWRKSLPLVHTRRRSRSRR